MAVSATALTTLANLKSALNVSSSDTSEDTYLEKLIDRATSWIEAETERRAPNGKYGLKARRYNSGGSTHATTGVSDEDYVYFHGTTKDKGGHTIVNPEGYGEFYLPAWPVQANSVLTFSLAYLTNRGSGVSGNETWDATVYVEWDDYIVDRERGVLRLLRGPFKAGARNYRVTMAAGYQTGSAQPYVPDDLEQLTIDLARMLYRDTKNIRSESMAGLSRSFGTFAEDPFVAQIIAKYRRYSL